MKHMHGHKKLGKDAKHRQAILRNLTRALLTRERVLTTITKAKQLKPFAEKIITRAKQDTLHNRRLLYSELDNSKLLVKLFEDIAKRYAKRAGGYTRLIKVGMRKGDGSEMCYLELTPELLTKVSTQADKPSARKSPDAEKASVKPAQKRLA